MAETYCIVDKRKTPCVDPSGYQRIKEADYNSFVNALFAEIKKLEM